ncbi:MAG TPA: molybdopterin cofactor-binding domain-containing protein [Pseudorhodoplanes sp.]|nr:molybdopterin cofactor-binding domain-containing protein [Pseudorhodoplanes sp.]
MNAPFALSRRALLKGGVLTVGFAFAGIGPRALAQGRARIPDPGEVDGFLAVNADGSVTLYCGKVDLGQGLRIAIRQMAAEELDLDPARITMVEGDTLLTPDQGPTAGSTGIQRGGVQIRQAAATARKALLDLGSKALGRPQSELELADGEVRVRGQARGMSFANLLAGQAFNLKVDPKAPLKDPAAYKVVGKPLPRPDVPGKCTGEHVYMQDFKVPGMLHARVIRPAAIGASLVSVDESSIASLPGARVVRQKDFLCVVAEDEWTAVKAQRALKCEWSGGTGLPPHDEVARQMRAGPFTRDEVLLSRGEAKPVLPPEARTLKASYYWPMHSHGSIGPSCAIADVKADSVTIWTASQAPHRLRHTASRFLGIPAERVRVIYLDGAGCYGMNGHDDAAAEAALLSRALGRPVRMQWSREDELGWDPKGPPQLLDIAGAIDAQGNILDWRTEMWLPEATRGLPNLPLLALDAAGIAQPQGLTTGLISQNGDPSYAVPNVGVTVHWLKDAPLRPSNLRAPGKIANCFAVESFFDELAAAAGRDPVDMRLRGLNDPRGIEVLTRAAAMMNWQPRPSPSPDRGGAVVRGRGIAYIHYKHQETWLAMGMEVAVERASGKIKVERVVCAHDCGLIVNPDGARAQVEGCILQTLSRTLFEDVQFDRSRVTSVDWSSYPILTFADVPKLDIDLIQRVNEPPLGAGEAATAPVAAALANAVFDATGVRLRSVPFTPERVKAALDGRAT